MGRFEGALFAIWIVTASWAVAAEPGKADGKGGAASNVTTPPASPPVPPKEAPGSATQGSIVSDVNAGKQVCGDLSGQAREACDARASATAQSPRGREGANPTGTGPGKPAESGERTGNRP